MKIMKRVSDGLELGLVSGLLGPGHWGRAIFWAC